MFLLSALLIGCDPVRGGDGVSEDTGNAFTYEDTSGEWTGEWDTADTGFDTGDTGGGGPSGDYDGDGWSVDDGDCDDYDPNSHPGMATDACDGTDNDCDSAVDEDFDEDGYEPNEDEGFPLGDLTGKSDVLYGYLYPTTEFDSFEFEVADGWWDYFGIDITLAGVPFDTDLGINLYKWNDSKWELVTTVDAAGNGGAEELSWDGSGFSDDGGLFSVVIYATNGESCSESYALEIAG